MSITTTITTERLERIIYAIESKTYGDEEIRGWVSSGNILELAHIVQALIYAGPLVQKRDAFEAWWEGWAGQKPFSGWENLRTKNGYNDEEIDEQYEVWDACSTTMLQVLGHAGGGEPVSQHQTLPDGWIAVPVEMSVAMSNAMTDVISAELCNAEIWDGVLKEAKPQ